MGPRLSMASGHWNSAAILAVVLAFVTLAGADKSRAGVEAGVVRQAGERGRRGHEHRVRLPPGGAVHEPEAPVAEEPLPEVTLEQLQFVDADLHATFPEAGSAEAEDSSVAHTTATCAGLAARFSHDVLADAAPGPDQAERSGSLSVIAERAANQREPTAVQFMKKVKSAPMADGSVVGEPSSSLDAIARKVKVLCATYTHDKKHDAVVMMRKAWGRHCTRHLIFTNRADDPALVEGHIDTQDIIKLRPKGGESYDNMWQKTRAAFRYLSEQAWVAREGFEYFFFAGDDAYLFVDNLRRMVRDPEIALLNDNGAALFFGYRQLTRDYDRRGHARPINEFSTAFVSGAGYVMNLAALQLAGHLVKHSRHCSPNIHASHEDVYLSDCLRGAGVLTRDARNAFGEDRFIVLNPMHMQYQARDQDYSWWWRDYRDRAMPTGLDIVAADTVLYHYIDKSLLPSIERHVFGKRLQRPTLAATTTQAPAAADDGAPASMGSED